MKNDHETMSLRVGVFDRAERADRAVASLLDAGVDRERISVVCAEDAPCVSEDVEKVEPAGSFAVPAALAGGTIGSVLGGFTALAGIALTGGTGLVVAGPLLGAAAAGGIAGGFIGLMTTRGFEPEIADYYDQALRDGQVLVAVDATDDPSQPSLDRAGSLLLAAGAKTRKLPSAS